MTPAIYNKLVDRFKNFDSNLTVDDYSILYYGQCFQKEYNPYGSDYENSDKFKSFYEKKDYEKALPLGLKMIDKDPMNIRMNFKVLVCYHYLKNDEKKAQMMSRYDSLLMTIFRSGDGKSLTTAFVVMRVTDEYEMMSDMQVQNTVQSLVQGPNGPCDMMTLKANDLGIEKLYFNVSKLFESMQNMFKNKN